MKQVFSLLGLCLLVTAIQAQVISIHDARAKLPGTTVTVRGVVTSGSELGVIRYFQDGTGGLAVYSTAMSNVIPGDSIEVSGTLGHFNNLLQISSNVTFTVLQTGLPIPAPVEFSTVSTPFAERYEGMLVKVTGINPIKKVVSSACNGTTTTFEGNTNYCMNGSVTTPFRVVNTASDLIGKNIPSETVDVIGIMSQFNKGSFSGGTTTDPAYYDTTLTDGFQLLGRSYDDLVLPPKPNIITTPYATGIQKKKLFIEFETQNAGTTKVEYGTTQTLGFAVSDTNQVTHHKILLDNLKESTVYWVKASSTNSYGTSTATRLVPVITASSSSGTFTAYFVKPVDTTVATFKKANYLNQLNDDTLIALISRAKYSLDIAIYNWNNNGLSNITQAVNDAYSRGVVVRIIIDGSTANLGMQSLNSAIPFVQSPQGANYTIMHNKFVIVDANSADPLDPMVWTGSTNWTKDQMNEDNNNVIMIQDQSLAKAYTMEFEEMWGSNTTTPNASKALFGQFKTDNTPHHFMIGGHPVEVYFSPSDGTNSQIVKTVQTADKDLYFALLVFTRSDISNAIRNKVFGGAYAFGIVDDSSNGGGNVFTSLQGAMGNNMQLYKPADLEHNKVLLVDPNAYDKDPIVLTGSHNWSSSADTKNDENTVIIHDPVLANEYYQLLVQNYRDNNNGTAPTFFANFKAEVKNLGMSTLVQFTDLTTFKPTSWQWSFGDGGSDNTQNPNHNYTSNGTFVVKLVASNGTLTDSAFQLIEAVGSNGVMRTSNLDGQWALYPNPTKGWLNVMSLGQETVDRVEIWTVTGTQVRSQSLSGGMKSIDMTGLTPGMYLVRLMNKQGWDVQKVVVQPE